MSSRPRAEPEAELGAVPLGVVDEQRPELFARALVDEEPVHLERGSAPRGHRRTAGRRPSASACSGPWETSSGSCRSWCLRSGGRCASAPSVRNGGGHRARWRRVDAASAGDDADPRVAPRSVVGTSAKPAPARRRRRRSSARPSSHGWPARSPPTAGASARSRSAGPRRAGPASPRRGRRRRRASGARWRSTTRRWRRRRRSGGPRPPRPPRDAAPAPSRPRPGHPQHRRGRVDADTVAPRRAARAGGRARSAPDVDDIVVGLHGRRARAPGAPAGDRRAPSTRPASTPATPCMPG